MLNFRPNGRRRPGRPLKRLLDVAETGPSRSDSCRLMIVIFSGSVNFNRDKYFISYFSFKIAYRSEFYCNAWEIIVVCVYIYTSIFIYLFFHSFYLSFFQSSVFLKCNTSESSRDFALTAS